ncbi:hypothetical protein WHR41_00557 [Cladosporium halotolerans]|uniref:Uncharacterized protein n=1 Tax=Cladosporium halotolerans TaxID=1052096 RepID=A0AB34L044_9PEZI
MDRDPWLWSVHDVAEYFRRYASQAAAQLPGVSLPPVDSFTNKLIEEEITGAVLMLDVDDEFLFKHCNVSKKGPRTAVLHSIRKLKAQSVKFKSQDDPMDWAEPSLPADDSMQLDTTSHRADLPAATNTSAVAGNAKAPELDVAPANTNNKHPVATVSTESTTEDLIRSGEQLVEDQSVKKRRRLNLSAITQVPTATETVVDVADFQAFLPANKRTVNDIFFGDVAVGQEFGQLQITDPNFVDEAGDEDNFQYINSQMQLGLAHCTSSQLRHFFLAPDQSLLLRNERPAKATFPYRAGLQATNSGAFPEYGRHGRISYDGWRSVMVVQHAPGRLTELEGSEQEAFVAIRESEAVLQSGAHELGFGADDAAILDGEHGHLLLKWQPEDDKDIPTESEGSTDEDANDTDELHSNDQGEDLAEESADDAIDETEVQGVVDSAIAGYIANWNEKLLPKLEKTAWSTWRMTKQSKTVRDQLIQGAKMRIQALELRMRKYVTDLKVESWETKSGLEKQCEVLQVTVEDIQKENWKIEVWRRRKEPKHRRKLMTARPHAVHQLQQTAQMQQPDGLAGILRNMGSDDRLTVSPHFQSSPPLDANLANGSEEEGERFHTAPDSPSHHVVEDPFVVLDGDDDAERGTLFDARQATPLAQMNVDDHEPVSQARRTSQPSPLRGDVFTKTPTRQPRSATPNISSTSRAQDVAATNPPDSSALRGTIRQQGTSPANVIDMTQLKTSPIEPTTPWNLHPKSDLKRKAKGTRDASKRIKTEMSTSEADNWKYEELAAAEDRTRILQKLLRDLGYKKRDEIHNKFQHLKLKAFTIQLESALDALQRREVRDPEMDTPRAQTMKLCARLLLAWFLARSEVVLDKYPPRDALEAERPPKDQTAIFVDQLRTCLMARNKALYSSPKPTSFEDPLIIDTDDESDHDVEEQGEEQVEAELDTKRRRKVALDTTAERKRIDARARMESQKQQSSNPAMLQTMVQAEFGPDDKIVNVTRKPEQDPIFVTGKLAKEIKPYQLDGVQFMWRELTSDPNEGQGCLLAHTMGLGKTMQSIALVTCIDNASKSPSAGIRHQLPQDLQLHRDRGKRSLRFLVICPPSLLQNWSREFRAWAPQHEVHVVEKTGSGSDYVEMLNRWSRSGGVMLIGYSIFRALIQRRIEEVKDGEQPNWERARSILLENTELTIADEAHHVKNTQTATAMAVSKLKSKARVALSGTPMSNDVDEIYALVSWVSPGFLGDKVQFSSFYGLPIKDGLYMDSTPSEKRNSTIKLKNLHYEIEPKVHRADISVLKGSLKPKVEFVLTVDLTEQQREAYAATVAGLLASAEDLDTTALTQIFAWLAGKNKSANAAGGMLAHDPAQPNPDGDEALATELDRGEANAASPEVPGDEDVYSLGFTKAIVDELVKDLSDDLDPTLSAKTHLLQQILRLSKQCGDKVLVFSANIPTLDYLRDLFERDKISFRRIDGGVDMNKRTQMLSEFQAGRVDVMLISTRAGGQGLNMQEANRVIIFDFGFNPAWEEQAIGRSYRFGQKKPVFVYRFLAGGTFEANIYNTQMFKTTLAKRVVDKKNPKRHAKRNTKEYLYPPMPVHLEDVSNELGLDLDPNVLSKIMQAQIDRGCARDPSIDICAIRTMEVLQADAADAPLNEEELRMVEQNKVAWRLGLEGPAASQAAMNNRPQPRMPGLPRSTAPSYAGAAAAPLNEEELRTVEQRRAAWRLHLEGIAASHSALNDHSQPRMPGPPESTASLYAGAAAGRTKSVPSATQVPSHATGPSFQPHLHAHNSGSNFAPRDIRNQAASGSQLNLSGRAASLGGLPFPRQ